MMSKLNTNMSSRNSFWISENEALRKKNRVLAVKLEYYKKLHAALCMQVTHLQKELYQAKQDELHYKEQNRLFSAHADKLLKEFTDFSKTSLLPFIEYREKTRISVSKETQALPSTICENVGKPYVNIERIPSDILGEHLAYESNITNDTEHSQNEMDSLGEEENDNSLSDDNKENNNSCTEDQRLNTLIEEDEDENSSVTIEIANISKLNQVPRVHLQPLDNIFYYLEKANQLKSLGSSSTFVNENKETDTLNSSLKVIPCTDEYEESVLKIKENGTEADSYVNEFNVTTQQEGPFNRTNNIFTQDHTNGNAFGTSTPCASGVILKRFELSKIENTIVDSPAECITYRRRLPRDALVTKRNKFLIKQTDELNYNQASSTSVKNSEDDSIKSSLQTTLTTNANDSNHDINIQSSRPSRRAKPASFLEPSLKKKMRR